MRKAALLVHTWLLLDFFGDARRDGREGSALTSAIFGQSFLAFAIAAIVFEPSLSLLRFAAINLSLSSLLVGVAALADPDREARRLADLQLFATAPLPRGVLPLARVVHGLVRTALLALGMAIPPAILCAFLRDGSWLTVPAYLGLAVLLAGLTSGAVQIVVRAVGRFGGSLRAALAAGTLRALLLGLGFAGFITCLPALRGGLEALPVGRAVLNAWPAWHAARWLADPTALDAASVLAGVSLAMLVLDALVGDVVRDDRGAFLRGGSVFARLEARLAGEGPLRGITAWTGAMLFRSAAFRSRVLPLVGLPTAMLAVTFAGDDRAGREMLLGVAMLLPAMGMPFLCAFLPRAEQDGAELVFRTSPIDTIAVAREAALLALSLRFLLPLQLIAAVGLIAFDQTPLRAANLSVFSTGVAVLAAAHATRSLSAVPFTASEDDPAGLELGALVPPTLLLAGLGAGFGLVADQFAATAGAVLAISLAALRLRSCVARSRRPA